MKLVTYIVTALLVVTLGAAGYLYLAAYSPLVAENAKLKAGLPELEKAKKELKKYKEKEEKNSREFAWVNPLVETLKAGLSDEISAGKAEVALAGDRVVLNIAEQTLYTPGSVTFAKDSVQTLEKIASLVKSIKDIKDKDIQIGNQTQSVSAQGKGRKRLPAKDGRTLAADRSLALIKFLEKKGVEPGLLTAVAYPTKLSERGFRIRDNKTIIVFEYPSTAAKPEAVSTAPVKSAPTGTKVAQPRPIPITPAQPKTH